MKVWFKLIWTWSWLITLPITCLFLFWGWETANSYYTFAVRYNTQPINVSLLKTGEKQFNHQVRKASLSLNPTANKDSNSLGLKMINLFVPESNLALLNSNLPHSGYQYVKGGIWNNKLQKIKFKYRGDFVYHWGEPKKSLRVKLSKKALFEGMRTFNLIAPKQNETYFGYLLANELGLIAPKTELVNVSLNGKLIGTHVLVEQLEELTLRNNNVMPGDIYAGELMGKDSYKKIRKMVFEHPGLWEKTAINNHFPEQSRKPLERLIQLLNSVDSETSQEQLSMLLDLDAWGKFSAFETLSQTFHYDNTHNWRLYYDPMRSKFLPIIWDPAGWNWYRRLQGVTQLDVIPSKLHQVLFKNTNYLLARHKALEEFYLQGEDKAFLDLVDSNLAKLIPAVQSDPYITDPEEVLLRLRDFRLYVENNFKTVYQGVISASGEVEFVRPDQSTALAFSVSGRRPVKRIILQYFETLKDGIDVKLRYWQNGQLVEKDINGAMSLTGSKIELSLPLLAKFNPISKGEHALTKNSMQVSSAYYELEIAGIPLTNELLSMSVDRGGELLESAKQVSQLSRHSFKDMYLIAESQPLKVPLVWSGERVIEGVQEINDAIVIEPGTTLRFKPGATLIFKNQLIAEGNPDQPIRFIPAAADQAPWGAVVLKSKEANGSRLKHVEFAGGSGLKGELFEYTAMFSVHDVRGVTVSHSLFRDSKITDDMVHTVYAEIRFTDSTFKRSLLDGLDIDISEAVIERCHFIDSGNDAVDLMTSQAVVIDSIIENSGDKAVSVGEGSHLLAINDFIKGNAIGVQTKDGSVAALYNVDFDSNAHALDAYKKNWRYNDGGKTYAYKSRLINNAKMITADKKSTIRLYDSYLDKHVQPTKKRIKFDQRVDSKGKRAARNKQLERNQKEMVLMSGFNSSYWDRVDVTTRGYKDIGNH